MKNLENELKEQFGKMIGSARKVCSLITDAVLRDREPPAKTTPPKTKHDVCITATADAAELSELFGNSKPSGSCHDGAICIAGNLFIYQEPGRLRLRFKPYLSSDNKYTSMWERVSDGKYRVIGDVSEEE